MLFSSGTTLAFDTNSCHGGGTRGLISSETIHTINNFISLFPYSISSEASSLCGLSIKIMLQGVPIKALPKIQKDKCLSLKLTVKA